MARRNSAARSRRARLSLRCESAHIIEAAINDEPILLVILADDRERAQVLRLDRETNCWRCGCFNAVWHPEKPCKHV
jgi:hypothetical protein